MTVRQTIRALTPRLVRLALAHRHYATKLEHAAWRLIEDEPEARLLPILCSTQRAAIDIGANNGAYTALMRKHCHFCLAVEPIPSHVEAISAAFLFDPKVRVLQAALSDHRGNSRLRVPRIGDQKIDALATLEQDNPLDNLPTVEIPVQLLRLDDVAPRDTGFIKIDVEGHEAAVLRGGQSVIQKDRPNLLVEIEERHRKNALKEFLSVLPADYRGYYYLDGHLHDISTFAPDKHQRASNVTPQGKVPGGIYVNNFVFSTNPARLLWPD